MCTLTIFAAARSNKVQLFKKALRVSACVSSPDGVDSPPVPVVKLRLHRALLIACRSGSVAIVAEILGLRERIPVEVKTPNTGTTAFHAACVGAASAHNPEPYIAIVELLLAAVDNKADALLAADHSGKTPLDLAVCACLHWFLPVAADAVRAVHRLRCSLSATLRSRWE
jgi:ankyrin repeat protein